MRWCLSQAGLSAVASEGRLIGTGIVREAWGEKDFPWALKGQQVLTMRSGGRVTLGPIRPSSSSGALHRVHFTFVSSLSPSRLLLSKGLILFLFTFLRERECEGKGMA